MARRRRRRGILLGGRSLPLDGGRGTFVGGFRPVQLGLAPIYDANNGGSTTQITDSSGTGLDALAFGATTAAPTYLAAPSTAPYFWLSGVVGNHVKATRAATVATSMRFRYCIDSMSVASVAGAFGWTSDAALSTTKPGFMMYHQVSGLVPRVFYCGASGSVQDSTTNLNTPAVPANTRWWEVTWVLATGAVTIRNSTSVTNIVGDVVWAAYNNWTGAATTGFTHAGGGRLAFGEVPYVAANAMGGYLRYYDVTVDDVVTATYDPNLAAQSGYTAADTTVWANNYGTSGLMSAAKSSAAADIAAGVVTDGSNDVATGPTEAIPALTSLDACTLLCVTRPRATMTTNMTFFSTRDGTGAGVTLRMASATTVVADISDGTSTGTTPAVTIVPGTRYVLGVIVDDAGTARCFANNTIGSTVARTGNDETGGALTVFANSTPGNFCRAHTRVPYAAAPTALTDAQIANLTAHYLGGV